jgi:mercuric ion binding protein
MTRIATIIAAAIILGLTGLGLSIVTQQTFAGGSAARASAQEQTATFAVDNMDCAACPITVRKAMKGVKGVKSVSVDFAAKTATVVFDPSVATPEAIAEASKNAGYPARPLL